MNIIILCRDEATLMTCKSYFSFKECLATSVFLIETTDHYVDKGGRVYALALHSSKAFEQLFNLLVNHKMIPLYIRLLYFMYKSEA